ncbi:hypothetical protein ACWF0M_13390 [Kribbella sp. NPDC055110]
MEQPPNDERVLTVEIDQVSGEFLTIIDAFDAFDAFYAFDAFEGFAEAVAALAARGGAAAPDSAALSPANSVVEIRLAD